MMCKLFTYTHASGTNQYNFVLAKVWQCGVTGMVTAGLEKSNGSLAPTV